MNTTELLFLQNRILNVLEKRFISPDGILYDYAGLHGEVVLPTPEECRENKPNALAWNTPIENGAFFNGDLMVGLIQCWEMNPSAKLARFTRIILKGLFVLQDHSPVPGCILRGLGSDGHCYYPASSNDQVVPFLLGVWQYSKSGMATGEERTECRERCYAAAKALEQNNWIIPGAKPGFERGNLTVTEPYDVSHIMIAAMILDEMEPQATSRVETLLQERIGIMEAGQPGITPDYSWFSTHNYYIQRMLAEQRENTPDGKRIRNGLNITARALKPGLTSWKKRKEEASFSPDWHPLNEVWFEQKNSSDAERCSNPQWSIWAKASPAVLDERGTVMASLATAWIILFSDDHDLIREVLPQIEEMLCELPYEKLYYVPFFFAINVISELWEQN